VSTSLHLLLTQIVSIVTVVMTIVLIAAIVVQHRAPGTTLAWLLAIILLPYVGVPLYLAFGTHKLRKRGGKAQLYAHPVRHAASDDSAIADMLCASGAPPPRPGNEVVMYTTGEAAYAAVIETLEAAAHSIHISTLILGNDTVGHAILDVLERKARAGVEVRLLLDSLYRYRSSRPRLRRMIAAGGAHAWFMPVWHVPFLSRARANLRLHRKIIVVDGATAIVGGMNLADEYMGPTPSPRRWRDLSARIRGPVVADIAEVFAADWAFAARAPLSPPPPPPPGKTATPGDAKIQVVGSGPDVRDDILYDAFLSAVFEARQRIWIATPYFVPDSALIRGLVLAARRGADVRVVVPARSNHITADYAGASYLRQLAAEGGQVCCYQPGMLHAKCVLVDHALAVIGSANLDMRSLFLNYEIALFLASPTEIAACEAWFASVWPSCAPLPPARKPRLLVEAVARLIGPLE
jgi:cardiolipin synthase